MSCSFDRERLAAYAGGELEAAERREVEEHVAGCAECRAMLEGLSRIVMALRELPAFEPPPDFQAVLRERLIAHASGWFEASAREAAGGGAGAGRVVPLARAAAPAREGRAPVAAAEPGPRRAPRAGGGWSLALTAAVAACALILGWGSASFFAGGRALDLAVQEAGLARSTHASSGGVSEASAGAARAGASAPVVGQGAGGSETPVSAPAIAPSGPEEPNAAGSATIRATAAAGFASASAVATGPVPERPPIARSAEIRLAVASMADAYAVTLDRIAAYQSLIVSSDFAGSETAEAHLDVRVPADRLDALLASLVHVGTVLASTVSGEDMTETIRALHDAEHKLVTLGQATADEAPGGAEKAPPEAGAGSVADELAQIHDQENAVEVRVNWATVTVTLVPRSGR